MERQRRLLKRHRSRSRLAPLDDGIDPIDANFAADLARQFPGPSKRDELGTAQPEVAALAVPLDPDQP